jgi:hypothetical protein
MQCIAIKNHSSVLWFVVSVNKIVFFAVPLFVLAVNGCSRPQSEMGNEQIQADQSPAGRIETKPVQAADLVGYDGKQLRKNVDKVRDAADQRNKELEDKLHEADDR